MNIEKNIAAMLNAARSARNENLTAFSAYLGIPVSTLQGYLKGTSSPRADTLELLAEKLGVAPADLVAGNCSRGDSCAACLDRILVEVSSVYPTLRPVAEDMVALLRALFHMSDCLYDLDASGGAPAGTYRYALYESRDIRLQTPVYGILAKRRTGEGWTTIAFISAFSYDREAVEQLARSCTELQLSPDHLVDVIHDFLAQHACGR